MNVKLDNDARLTDEHSASCYGIPVLVYRDVAYGPGDIVPLRCDLGSPDPTAAILVATYVNSRANADEPLSRGNKFSAIKTCVSDELVDAALRFCRSDPTGPQVSNA